MFWVVARSFHGPSYTIESQWGNFGTLLPPRGATFTPFWGMVLQSLPVSSNVANFKFLWNPLSELRGITFFRNVKSMRFFGALFRPWGRTSYPRSLIKVIAHHSRLGRTFWHLIHGSVAKTAGGVARRSLVRANSNYNTRMYIFRRKCEMVLAVAKLGDGQILVTSMFAIIFLAWLASCYHVASMISMLLACC